MKKYRILGALLAACMFTAAVPVTAGAANVTASTVAAAKLPAPTNIKAKISGTSAKITWKKVDGADAYRVYKYNPGTKKYETYKNVAGTTCNVKGLSVGNTYKFKIAALVKSGSKYKVQTPTSTLKLTVKQSSTKDNTGSVSSSSSKGAPVSFPAFGVSMDQAIKSLGIKDAQKYTEKEITGYVGSVNVKGTNEMVALFPGKDGNFFYGAVILTSGKVSFDDIVKSITAAKGKPAVDMNVKGMDVKEWIDSNNKVELVMNYDLSAMFSGMGSLASDMPSSLLMYGVMDPSNAPASFKADNLSSLGGLGGLGSFGTLGSF